MKSLRREFWLRNMENEKFKMLLCKCFLNKLILYDREKVLDIFF